MAMNDRGGSPASAGVIHVLTGPTAVGKTELALRWAEANGAEILSCDSLLFYRGMDIGTAKPTRTDLARVPHHLVDLCEPHEQMDVTRYVVEVRRVLAELVARGRAVLVTGGSGFYLKSFIAPVADDVAVPAELRAELRRRLEETGLEPLLAELRARNPGGLGALDIQNPRRVLRALERCTASGRTLLELQTAFAAQPPPYGGWQVRLCVLEREKAELAQRIEARVAAMLRDGLVDEVRALLRRGLRDNPSAAGAIGYRETVDFLEGRITEAALAPAIVQNTQALVRKQRTWFRTQLPPHQAVAATTATLTALFPDSAT